MLVGWGFLASERVKLYFVDSSQGRVFLTKVQTFAAGSFSIVVTIPNSATPGKQHLRAVGVTSGQSVKAPFTVT